MRAWLRRLLQGRMPPGFYRIGTRPRVQEILDAARRAGWHAAALRGDAITDKASFLDAIAAGMAFPAYFGRNWDALDEVLTDPDALPGAAGYLLIWDNPVKLARSQPETWRQAREVLEEAVAAWQREGKPFVVLLREAGRSAPDVAWV